MFIDTFADYGIEIPPGATGETRALCPNCSHTRKKSREKILHVNVEKGTWRCWNDGDGCGFNGRLRVDGEAQRNFGTQKVKRVYARPDPEQVPENVDFPEATVKFFEDRCISLDVVRRRGIWRDAEGLHFPYYRDGELVNIKTRKPPKEFRMVKDAELVFYGLDDCVGAEQIVIVEGEMDALAIETATGFQAILSVPNGATIKGGNLSYMDSATDLLGSAHTVVLAVDNDEAGKALEKELARRIGRAKCFVARWPLGCKDANDVLVSYSAQVLQKALDDATPYPDSGIILPREVKPELLDMYDNPDVRGLSTGWENIDEYYTVKPGQLTVVTGAPGSGKSEWLDALLVNLAKQESEDWSTIFFSPENFPVKEHLKKITEKYVGKPFAEGKTPRMTIHEVENAVAWSDFHFTFLGPDTPTLDHILDLAHTRILQTGAKGLVIDPWNELSHVRPRNLSETEYIGEALSKIKRFGWNHDVATWVVAHPTKLPKGDDGQYVVPTPYDISGSANWFNKADNCITIWRDKSDPLKPVEVHIQKIRFKNIGKLGMAELNYDIVTGRYSVPYFGTYK